MENGEPLECPTNGATVSLPRTRAGVGVGVGNGSDPLLLSADTGRTEQLECGNLLQLGPLRLCLSSSERTQAQVPAPARGHVRAELSFSSAVASSSVFFFKTKKQKKKRCHNGASVHHQILLSRVLPLNTALHAYSRGWWSPTVVRLCTVRVSCYTAHACRVSVVVT